MITREEVASALPANLKSSATQGLVDAINGYTSDPEIADTIGKNFISFTSVLKDARFTTEQYLNAVAYVSYKLMDYTNHDAYKYTFPQRYARMVAEGKTNKEISSYVAIYHRGKLVNQLMEQALVPLWVVNQHYFQEALLVQVDLMRNSASDKVRCEAASSVMANLQKPKDVVPLVSIDIADTGMNALKEQIAQLAHIQRNAILEGTPAHLIAAIPMKKATIPDVIEG